MKKNNGRSLYLINALIRDNIDKNIYATQRKKNVFSPEFHRFRLITLISSRKRSKSRKLLYFAKKHT